MKAKLERKKSSASIREENEGKRNRRAGVIGTSTGLILTPHLPPLDLPNLFSPSDFAEVTKDIQSSEVGLLPSESQSSYLTPSDSANSTNATASTQGPIVIHEESLPSIPYSNETTSSLGKSNSDFLARPSAVSINKLSGLSAQESSNSMITASSTESSAKSYSAYLS